MNAEPVPRSIDLCTAAALSATYGMFGAITAVLLMPEIAKRTEAKLPLPLPVFAVILAVQLTILYGVLGWCGLRLARRAGLEPAPWFTSVWMRRARAGSAMGVLLGCLGGLCSGAALVVGVKAITYFLPGTLPSMLHPPNLLSAMCASTAGSIGEEILCRLLLVSVMLAYLPSATWSRPLSIVLGALTFGLLHTPAMIALYGSFADVPGLAWVWIIGLNAAVGCVFGAVYVRWGIEAAIIAHWSCNLLWHIGSVAWS